MTSDTETLYSCSEPEARQYITELAAKESGIKHMEAQNEIFLATVATQNWKDKRSSGRVYKSNVGLQRFLCTIGDFMRNFAGVAEIIKSADQQFGGLAYGTIVLLAEVAVIKEQREETVQEVLEELGSAFPRLNTLQQLQPSQQMLQLIAGVFELTIQFCRETIVYFAKSSFGRTRNALKPGEAKLKTISQLRIKPAEIPKEMEIILLERLHSATLELRDMRIRLEDNQRTGKDTNERVQDNQSRLRLDAEMREKNEVLLDLRRHLGLKTNMLSLSTTVKLVSSMLQEEFSSHGRNRRGIPQQMSASLLEQDDTITSWTRQESSSMLVLAGSNFVDDASVQLNWLSYASVWAAESMQSNGHVLAVFCQPSYRVTDRLRRSFPDIIRNLIYQLAEYHPTGLRAQREEIVEALHSSHWTHESPELLSSRWQRRCTA
jgi:hypothetical protein